MPLVMLTTGAVLLARKISDKKEKIKAEKRLQLQKVQEHDQTGNVLANVDSNDTSTTGDASSTVNSVSSVGSRNSLNGADTRARNTAIYRRDGEAPTLSSPAGLTTSQQPDTWDEPPPYSPIRTTSSPDSPARTSSSLYSSAGNSSMRSSSSRATSIAETCTLPPGSAVSTQSSNTFGMPLTSADVPRSSTDVPRSSTDVPRSSADDRCLRIRTKGSDLKSGFPYTQELFEVRVNPDLWEIFNNQIIEATRFEGKDYATLVGAATATALTGAIMTGVYVGHSVKYSLQEKRVREGLENMDDGGLGNILERWNENEFKKLGLFVHLELSDSAKKRPNQRTPSITKHPILYSKRADRERKAEERKFCIVVTKLDSHGVPAEALRELVDEDAPEAIQELVEEDVPASEIQDMVYQATRDPTIISPTAQNPENEITSIPELPGDEGLYPVELPAEVSLGFASDSRFIRDFAELDSTPITNTPMSATAEKAQLKQLERESQDRVRITPATIMVTAETHNVIADDLPNQR